MAKLLLLYLAFASAIVTCSATNYIVGDSSGWDISTNLGTWVQDKKFQVGDSLVFQYGSSESVNEVTRENFNTCNTTNVLATYGNGNTTVALTKPGDMYFVSGNRLLCLGGMKLHVHIQDNGAYSPALAPSPVSGSDQGGSTTLTRPPSSQKNTPVLNGAFHCAREPIHLVYMALLASAILMLNI
ncbi:hypothetical protein L6164_008507 [Bauhinia variegata]|uniref:Uncharacterized protein n=1 Tax=Bauhinia variegata TaxID=167791 RepID=A0ACB9PH77_BAUVA|nr:hypothetical protein L6164_008507 [Bauhinia variegata]